MPSIEQSQDSIADETATGADVEMTESAEPTQGGDAGDDDNGEQALVETEPKSKPRVTFASYLMSPVVTLTVGTTDQGPASLTAHQALLTQSPYFREICSAFADDGSVGRLSKPIVVTCLSIG